MQKFDFLKGKAAPLPMINVDTDMIIPKQFLKTIKRSGLGKNLFHELRYDLNGNMKNDFVLNWEYYKDSKILIAGENFGCGSSREHAPWSLLDFGFRCIIAPSFADIFYNNCFKNGILPIKLEKRYTDYLLTEAKDKKLISVDLKEQKITTENKTIINFDVDSFRKKCLLEGLDDIALTMKNSKKIDIYEEKVIKSKSWLTL
ncbi:MAG: 3-isopropylmalate dehydratase small subunit [Pelagibacteraceae bacterium TMED65]|nr:3-isopropylmalate dehydratase small subunit [Rickettsiales bacterium]OUU52608.1 MAG: 3-isopropylmalate dehydratase small subunit [Pelagibacteraceae bacterium TMED65]